MTQTFNGNDFPSTLSKLLPPTSCKASTEPVNHSGSLNFSVTNILGLINPIDRATVLNYVRESSLIDASSLLLQLSLHLPRFPHNIALQGNTIMAEAKRLSQRLHKIQAPYISETSGLISDSNYSLQDMRFCEVSENISLPILNSFHYILSARSASYHFGLKASLNDLWPVIMCSLSPFDLANITPVIEERGYRPERCMVLSRVFAFPACPKNAVSYLLRRLRCWLKDHKPEVELLLTYVNPNMGFTGACYLADNWTLLAYEGDTRYAYWDQNYITDRKLATRTQNESLLSIPENYSCITYSRCHLQPLKIMYRSVQNTTGRNQISKAASVPHWTPYGL